MTRPFSQACENNKDAILAVLTRYFNDVDFVLEIGSGTGQHAAYFSGSLPHLRWQPADRAEYLTGINQWRHWAQQDNLLAPLELDVNKPWPINQAPAIFSANTVHIMSWSEVEKLFSAVKNVLEANGIFCLYGPFNYGGRFSSESNAQFDRWLKTRDSLSGIRDFEAIDKMANHAGLSLLADCPMPANNRCIVWQNIRKNSE